MTNKAKQIARIVLSDPDTVKVHFIDEDELWGTIRILADLVLRAKPMVEMDATMMGSLTRFSPLPHDDQAKFDNTEMSSEKWIRDYEAIMKGDE